MKSRTSCLMWIYLVLNSNNLFSQSIYDTIPLATKPVLSGPVRADEPALSNPPRVLPLEIRQRHQSSTEPDFRAEKASFQAGDAQSESLLLRRAGEDADKPQRSSPLVTVLSALSIVLGLYLGFVWLARRGQRNNDESYDEIPAQVASVLGSFPLSTQQDMHVIRFGSKLLAVVLTVDGCQPIGEINDPEEVEYLTKVCHYGPNARMPVRLADLIEPEYSPNQSEFRRR